MIMIRVRLAASLCAAAMLYSISAGAAEPANKTDSTPVAPAAATTQKPDFKPVENPWSMTQLEDFRLGKKVDNTFCLKCHDTIKGSKAKAAHHGENCVACHTPRADKTRPCGKGEASFPEADQCLSCHKNDPKLINWKFSEHSKADGKCTDCHEIHAASPSKRLASTAASLTGGKMHKSSAACVNCHQDITSRLNMTSHHPVKEGGMTCISCHNPHGSGKTTILKSNSEQCLSCHQAMRGPMVFEHAPVVEDCMNCHTPHGSPNRRLLSVSQPAVCLQCHSIAQGKHGYGTGLEPALTSGTRTISGAVLRNCTNCHGAIHGSHQDPLLRY